MKSKQKCDLIHQSGSLGATLSVLAVLDDLPLGDVGSEGCGLPGQTDGAIQQLDLLSVFSGLLCLHLHLLHLEIEI